MGQSHSDVYKCNNGDSNTSNDIPTASTKQAANIKKSNTTKPDNLVRRQNVTKQESKCSNNTLIGTREHQVRRLSNVSNRNIQLLSMKPRSEKETFAEDLRNRRKNSLINLILGAPSSGPRFSDDLCSLNSFISDCNFGIEFFADIHRVSSQRLESIEDVESGDTNHSGSSINAKVNNSKRRRSSLDSLAKIGNNGAHTAIASMDPSGAGSNKLAPSTFAFQARKHFQSKRSIADTLASIDLTSSLDQHDKSGRSLPDQFFRPSIGRNGSNVSNLLAKDIKVRASRGRVNQTGRVLRKSGSELSLYSGTSASSGSIRQQDSFSNSRYSHDHLKETKLIILLQVCLPFMLAGFGNMGAGLVLNKVSQWQVFHQVPIFFVLLPPFVGLRGNIEMTLASRLSTLANLNLLSTSYQKRRAFLSNMILVLSQAISLSSFATYVSIACEMLIGVKDDNFSYKEMFENSVFVVLSSALITSVVLVILSCLVICCAVALAKLIRVNPDNLSTLIAALYGDVSCVLTYGLVANWMFQLKSQNILIWPMTIIIISLLLWPILLYSAYKFDETRNIALSSMPPMLTGIMVSMGSGAILSLVIERYHLIALYQPVVNGFGANLVAVQASRVSTWLWCATLRKLSVVSANESDKSNKTLGSLVSFSEPIVPPDTSKTSKSDTSIQSKFNELVKTILWSFCNSSPNSIAARMLLIMLIPAHSVYFFIICLLSSADHVVITWQFYSIYISLCLIQVFILLAICEPLMTFLMNHNLDPDNFGISLLMALADLTGTLCLAGAFILLEKLHDPNAT